MFLFSFFIFYFSFLFDYCRRSQLQPGPLPATTLTGTPPPTLSLASSCHSPHGLTFPPWIPDTTIISPWPFPTSLCFLSSILLQLNHQSSHLPSQPHNSQSPQPSAAMATYTTTTLHRNRHSSHTLASLSNAINSPSDQHSRGNPPAIIKVHTNHHKIKSPGRIITATVKNPFTFTKLSHELLGSAPPTTHHRRAQLYRELRPPLLRRAPAPHKPARCCPSAPPAPSRVSLPISDAAQPWDLPILPCRTSTAATGPL